MIPRTNFYDSVTYFPDHWIRIQRNQQIQKATKKQPQCSQKQPQSYQKQPKVITKTIIKQPRAAKNSRKQQTRKIIYAFSTGLGCFLQNEPRGRKTNVIFEVSAKFRILWYILRLCSGCSKIFRFSAICSAIFQRNEPSNKKTDPIFGFSIKIYLRWLFLRTRKPIFSEVNVQGGRCPPTPFKHSVLDGLFKEPSTF